MFLLAVLSGLRVEPSGMRYTIKISVSHPHAGDVLPWGKADRGHAAAPAWFRFERLAARLGIRFRCVITGCSRAPRPHPVHVVLCVSVLTCGRFPLRCWL